MRFLKRAAFIPSGILAGLILAELLARGLLPYPTRQIALLRMRAPDLQMDAGTDMDNPDYNPFLQRRPHSEWVCDGKAPERMNNEGFRDRDFIRAKKNTAVRIAALGDSFTEGWMAPRSAAFPRVLEAELGARFEVLNFGLANRSPLRYLALYEDIVRKYHPDVVLVCLYKNDVAEDEALRPYVTFDAEGVPRQFDFARYFRHTPRMPQTRWEKRRDRWQWLFCRFSRVYPYVAVMLAVDPDFRRRTLETPPSEAFDSLWRRTAGYLRLMKERVERDGARYLLAYAPDAEDFKSPDRLCGQAGRFASENKIPFFDAAPFLASTNVNVLYLPEDGHFSTEGHRVYAGHLAAWLQKGAGEW